MRILSISENTLLLQFDQQIDDAVFAEVMAAKIVIESRLEGFIIDLTPSYASIHIVFNLMDISHAEFVEHIQRLELQWQRHTDQAALQDLASAQTIDIPVYYGPEVAWDLPLLCEQKGLSIDNVIQYHCEQVYTVYAIGFAPGFAYLGTVDQAIAMPRKTTPRAHVASGSVGIADQQTAVYPADSPGGWQIIGRTPMAMVDYQEASLTRVNTGDRIRFIAIDRARYLELGGQL